MIRRRGERRRGNAATLRRAEERHDGARGTTPRIGIALSAPGAPGGHHGIAFFAEPPGTSPGRSYETGNL